MKSLSFVLLTLISTTIVSATNHFAGIVAANSIGGQSTYTCRTQAQWNDLAKKSKDNGFKSIRVLGFDCDALHRASRAAASNGLKVLAGIYIPGSIAANIVNINNEVQIFRSAYAEFGADRYIGLTVGNEVNDSVGNIMAKVYDVRGYLGSVGVKTPVSTVHNWVRIRDEPALCGADFVAANAHTYYDGNRQSSQAGEFVYKLVVPALKQKCRNKKVMITESGWPSKGPKNDKATPSTADEKTALSSLNCAAKADTSVQLFAFEADDQAWKGNDVEKGFGVLSKFTLGSDVFKAC